MQPFCIAAIGAILGIVTGLYLNSIAFLLGLIILLILFLKLKSNNKFKKIIILFSIFYIIFFGYTINIEKKYNRIINEYKQQEVIIQGIVVSNVKEKRYKVEYEIQVNKIYNKNLKELKNEKFKIICSIKGKKTDNQLNYGDEVIIKAIFKVADEKRNEGGFDYNKYLKTKKTAGKVEINSKDITVINNNKCNVFLAWINNFRNALLCKIEYFLPYDEAALCSALLLGDKSELSTQIENEFREASLSHMLAISGAHISCICGAMIGVVEYFKIHKRWANMFMCVFMLFFIFLTGATPSVVRACIMMVLKYTSNILFLKSNTYNNLGISIIIILFINPYSLFDIGLQLSYGGTIGIVTFVDIFYDIRLRKKGIVKSADKTEKTEKIQGKKYSNLGFKLLIYVEQTVIMALAANMIILPIMVYNFGTIYLTFIISNLLATPVMSLCLVVGLIFLLCIAIKPLAYLISIILNPLLKLFIFIAKFVSSIPISKLLIPTPKIWQIVIYYVIINLYFFRNKIKNKLSLKRNKKIIVVLIIIIITPYILLIFPKNKLEINFIDVGQGDSMLITTPSGKKVLIDGGGSEFGSYDVGEQTLMPYLLEKAVLKIDYMMFTHFDSDHCKGLLTILKNLHVSNVIIGEQGENSENFKEFLTIIKEKNVNIIKVKSGDKIKIDKNCELEILFPDTNLIKENILNNNSIVAKFMYGNFSILLTGDIEKIAEEKLIDIYKKNNRLNATILKVAHHGSKSSSIQEFLNLVKPQIALIGVGAENSYGHPSEAVIERLENMRLYNLQNRQMWRNNNYN